MVSTCLHFEKKEMIAFNFTELKLTWRIELRNVELIAGCQMTFPKNGKTEQFW